MADDWKKLEDVFKKIDRKDVKKLILQLLRLVMRRAFPPSGRARGTDGKSMPNLSPGYKAYKSGKVRYATENSKARATGRRKATGGSPVSGPRSEGRRLAPRPGLPNNQLSGKTAQSLHAKATSKNEGKLYFISRGEVGASLEDRKPWIEPNAKELEQVRKSLEKIIVGYVDKLPKNLINFDLGTIKF
jgi:hypothetical protein